MLFYKWLKLGNTFVIIAIKTGDAIPGKQDRQIASRWKIF